MRRAVLSILIVACYGCVTSSPEDVVGPYTGELHRFVVDQLEVPTTSAIADEFGDDLDGDHEIDNQGGSVLAILHGQGDGDVHVADQIASGILASVVVIQADDLTDDPTVAVSYLGVDTAPATVAGGPLAEGILHSNRLAVTRVPGAALLRIPAFADSDPIDVPTDAVEIDLAADGSGGFNATLRCALHMNDIIAAAIDGVLAMIAFNPQSHLSLAGLIDSNQDGILTRDEVAQTSLFRSLMVPDVRMFLGDVYAPGHDGDPDAMALGFRFHLKPCATGNCALAPPQNPCFDRVLDGDETDLDCGGSCQPCPDGARCARASDCQTGTCNADGTCASP